MSTAGTIIDGAFKLCGVRLPTMIQRSEALDTLNDLLAVWSAERLMVHKVVEECFTLTIGAAFYTIGPSGSFNTVRPHKIESAFLRDSVGVDTTVDPTMSLSELNRITSKNTRRRPDRLYYAQEFPLGTIEFDVQPDAEYTLRLYSWKPLTSFADLTTTVVLPAEYAKALRYHLAIDLAPELNVQLDRTVIDQAIGSRNIIQNLNRAAVSPVRFDTALVRGLAT